MKSFSFNYDSKWEQTPYGISLNSPQNYASSQEITVDTDFKTISRMLSDSLIEIVKKNFETTSKSFEEGKLITSTEEKILETE